jgi:hypothetical protein
MLDPVVGDVLDVSSVLVRSDLLLVLDRARLDHAGSSSGRGHVVVDRSSSGPLCEPGLLGNSGELVALVDPAPGREADDVEEGGEGEPHRHSRRSRVGDGALDGGEGGSSSDAHDEDAGRSAGVATEVLGGED